MIEMRDRLIDLIKQNTTEFINPFAYEYGDSAEQFADHLLANGVIVPPCKVGQIVYQIYWDFRIDKCKVSALTQKSDESWKIRVTSGINRSVFEITPDKLGKTVFLTKEEAEKALERSGK